MYEECWTLEVNNVVNTPQRCFLGWGLLKYKGGEGVVTQLLNWKYFQYIKLMQYNMYVFSIAENDNTYAFSYN